MIPSAKSDPRLSPTAHRVLRMCEERETRTAPTAGIAARLCQMPRTSATKAIRRLISLGYLERAA